MNNKINNNDESEIKKLYVRMRAITRYLVDYPKLMKLFIENVFGFSNGELISLRIISDTKYPFQFDFSNLVGTVEELINDVKYYINKFRPFMSK